VASPIGPSPRRPRASPRKSGVLRMARDSEGRAVTAIHQGVPPETPVGRLAALEAPVHWGSRGRRFKSGQPDQLVSVRRHRCLGCIRPVRSPGTGWTAASI